MSRLTVAWVTTTSRPWSAATSSRWLPIDWRATSSRMARCRSRFAVAGVTDDEARIVASGDAGTGSPAGGDARTERRVGQRPFQGVRGGRVGDDRLRLLPGDGAQGGPDLGDHAAVDHTAGDQRLRLAGGERVQSTAVAVAHPVHVGQQDQLTGPQPG